MCSIPDVGDANMSVPSTVWYWHRSSLTFRICPSVYFPSRFLINSVNGGTVVPKSTVKSGGSVYEPVVGAFDA